MVTNSILHSLKLYNWDDEIYHPQELVSLWGNVL